MSQPVKRGATYDDLVRLPDTVTGQIIDGDLYAMPRPAGAHAFVASLLGGDLHVPFQRGRDGPGGWWIIDEPEVHFASNVLVPDITGWRREQMPQSPTAEERFFTLTPNWVCEVLSPSTASLDRVRKRRVYEGAGVQWLWYIDPIGRTLEAFEWVQGRYSPLGTWGPGESPNVAPFDAIALDLDAIWGSAEPEVALRK